MSFKYEKPLYKTYKHNKKRKPTKAAKAKLEQARPSAVTTLSKSLIKSYVPAPVKPKPRKSFTKAIELPKESPISDADKRRLARKAAKEEEARKERIRQYQIDKKYELSLQTANK